MQSESPWLESLEGEKREMAGLMLKSGLSKGKIEAEFEKKGLKEADDELVTVKEAQLSDEQREAFKAAFLEKDTPVQWQGEMYTIVTMDQAYPEDESDHIPVSFQLKRVSL